MEQEQEHPVTAKRRAGAELRLDKPLAVGRDFGLEVFVEGVSRSDLVASWGDFTGDDANLMDLARLRGEALRIMEEVDFDG